MAFAHPRKSLGLRSMPQGSSGTKSPAVRSPIKTVHEEQHHLSLRKIIGTTTATSNAFDALPATRTIAYTAGATIVVTTFDETLTPVQKSFRAKPSTSYVPVPQPALDSPTPAGRSQLVRERYPASVRGQSNITNVVVARDAADSPDGRAAALKERTKATTCVSLSPDGKFVAAGESGHKPRVLIFSLDRDAPTNGPFAALVEHTFGVKCLAFSPNSQYLASLGDLNDGYLYIWHLNTRSGTAELHANNRCTSNVRHMAWCGNSLVTVGTRHVKIWRLDKTSSATPSKRLTETSFSLTSPSKALAGRNCLLGSLLDKTYTSVAAVDTKRAIVCSDEGDVCLLDDNSSPPLFRKVNSTAFSISAATIGKNDVLTVGGPDGQLASFQMSDLLSADIPEQPIAPLILEGRQGVGLRPAGIVALESFEDKLVILDSGRSIRLIDHSIRNGSHNTTDLVRELHSHDDAIIGVVSLSSFDYIEAAFLTCSADGNVLVWNALGDCTNSWHVPVLQQLEFYDGTHNEIRALAIVELTTLVATGDRSGMLRISSLANGTEQYQAKAHASEICSIATEHEGDTTHVATAGRDKAVQIFRQTAGSSFELMQTLESHAGAVTAVEFSSDGKRLLSCSTDRTIVVHDAVTGKQQGQSRTLFVDSRIINLKASPLSMILTGSAEKQSVRVTLADKSVINHGIDAGGPPTSFRAADEDDNDPVNLNAICQVDTGDGHTFVAGCSTADKSVRLYDTNGVLVKREYGHTEGLIGIASISHDDGTISLVTVATDSTIFLWDIVTSANSLRHSPNHYSDHAGFAPLTGSVLSSRPPLRRVVSSSELIQLQTGSDGEAGSPTSVRQRSRSPKHKVSRSNLRDHPKLDATPPVTYHRRANNSSDQGSSSQPRRISRSRPVSPDPILREKSKPLPKSIRRQSSQPILSSSRRRSIGSGPKDRVTPSPTDAGLRDSTQQLCRALHTYRKRLAVINDPIPAETVRELEKELSLTVKLLAEKTPARSEIIMEKLIEKYSEKLVSMLDQRVEEKVKDLIGIPQAQSRPSPASATDEREEIKRKSSQSSQ